MSTDDGPGYGDLFAAHDTPDDRARDEARRAVEAAILRMARAAGAPVRERTIAPGYSTTISEAEPLAGIAFALMLTDAARHEIHHYIRRAREDGAGWRQIGQALRLERDVQERGDDLGAEAFEYAAGPPAQRFDRLWFVWTCPSCQQAITDYGPYDSHPDDCERGHADGCQRRAAAVAAYEARWADED